MKKEPPLSSSILAVVTVLSLIVFALRLKPLYGADRSQITLQIDGMV